MDVKIFQTKNLGFIVTEVSSDCGCDETYCITNPRMLQMFVSPNPEAKSSLQIQLMPLVYKEVLVEPTYETQIEKSDYVDVTDQFDPQIIDMYLQVEGRVEEAQETVNLFD